MTMVTRRLPHQLMIIFYFSSHIHKERESGIGKGEKDRENLLSRILLVFGMLTMILLGFSITMTLIMHK